MCMFALTGIADGSPWTDVIAFYPFNDRHSGSDATGATVCNVLNPAKNCGLVTSGGNATSQATFDADAPGKYVFVGTVFPGVPVYTNPASIHLTADSSVNGEGGNVTFQRLGNDFSAHRENGQTIEYFIKMDDSAFKSYIGHCAYEGGYRLADGSYDKFALYMPFSSTSYEGREFRYAIKYYGNNNPVKASVPNYSIFDGKWHHVAIVETNLTISVWLDYRRYGSITIAGTTNLSNVATDRNLDLGRNAHHAKYSCLKLTKRALGNADFLRASNSETHATPTGFHWTFDGLAGAALPGVLTSSVDSLATLNPEVYAAVSAGNGNVYGDPVYGGKLMYSRTLVDDGFGGMPRKNTACAYFESKPLTTGYYRSGPCVAFEKTGEQAGFLLGDFTVEGFFKFDQTGWMAIDDELLSSRNAMTLFAESHSDKTVLTVWSCSINAANGSPKLCLRSYSQDGTKPYATSGAGLFADGKWHHVAVTYDKASCRFVGYYDYNPVVTNQLAAPIGYADGGNFYVGNGPAINENAFHGWVDEIRLRRECLEPVHFLRQIPAPRGFMITFH